MLLIAGLALYVASFPPFNVAECAYIFAIFLYASAKFWKGSSKRFFATSVALSTLAWCVILAWLRFVYPPSGYFFAVSLSSVLGFFMGVWLLVLKRLLPSPKAPFFERFSRILAVAIFWVGLEYLRSFLFTGFPWAFLGHTQWLRPSVIQISEFGGVYIVSFMLIFFNLGLSNYIFRLLNWHKAKVSGELNQNSKFARLTPEFYIAAIFVMASLYLYILNMPKIQNAQTQFRVGMVQTDFAGILNWDASLGQRNLETLRALTLPLKKANADVVLWSESATPPMWPVLGVPAMREWVEQVSKDADLPILMGNGAYFPEKIDSNGNLIPRKLYNAAFYVSNESGLDENFYAKRHLVPFGEYVPSWCAKLVRAVIPMSSADAGEGAVIFNAKIKDKIFKISPVICYEDAYAPIVRDAVLAGADYIFVCTNDSWYGREGGAWQHASLSAFQAVSFRRPVLRASLNGLSGVFDQYGRLLPCFTLHNKDGKVFDGTGEVGNILDVYDEFHQPISLNTGKRKLGSPLLDDNNNIYFRGAGYADLITYSNFDKKLTFYAKNGDVFAKTCYYLSILLLIFLLVKSRVKVKKTQKNT